MKSKEEIIQNWLPRYTGQKLEKFGSYILLTNFSNYVEKFAKWNKVRVVGKGKPMHLCEFRHQMPCVIVYVLIEPNKDFGAGFAE